MRVEVQSKEAAKHARRNSVMSTDGDSYIGLVKIWMSKSAGDQVAEALHLGQRAHRAWVCLYKT